MFYNVSPLRPLLAPALQSNFSTLLQSFVNAYGSSYVQQYDFGAYAASVVGLTGTSYGTLQSDGIALSATCESAEQHLARSEEPRAALCRHALCFHA